MKVIGIIAEYNPFHNGHRYLIEEAKRSAGADYAVAVMSGDFVQRGTPAIWDKYTRTQMALAGGADLVLELPVAAATGSAQRFAESAVHILNGLGVIDILCFGSEAGSISPFLSVTQILHEEPPQFRESLQRYLRKGLSYPSARANALREILSASVTRSVTLPDDLDTFLSSPNNILGIEYCLALRKQNSLIRPVTIRRIGSGYHAEQLPTDHSFGSASAIRSLLETGLKTETAGTEKVAEPVNISALAEYIPASSLAAISESRFRKSAQISEDDFSDMLRYQLQKETRESLRTYLDIPPDLADRIWENRYAFSGFRAFAAQLKAKNFTRTQINRALLHILLNLHEDDLQPALTPADVRMLGFHKDSRPLLSAIKQTGTMRLVTSPLKSSDPHFVCDTFASNLYASVFSAKTGLDFQHEYTKEVQLS